ncbi:hypothetical protein CERSUDRAFT_159950 [Gelatoporia subvermispora B]|uniref:NAD(+) diphosphatase n=1 Tax=Ceriporiopsis subvermispora (strain B) TaxID=914234 RepID=M2R6A1_CERS8|nr:hypothetical protein CERSUDRAFT_159950 [Gelatoporia subvermispora B]
MVETYTNFLGGSPLNRLSWLRTSHPFLNTVLLSPTTRWIVFRGGEPLLATEPNAGPRSLARLTTADVRSLLGPEPFFAQGKEPDETAEEGVSVLEAARFRGPPVVFLGLHEPQTGDAGALPSSDFSAKGDSSSVVGKIEGTPYFSVDLTDVETEAVDQVLAGFEAGKSGVKLEFVEPRAAMQTFDLYQAAVFAEARSMVDWNSRNKFCPSCGSPVYSLWAGWKLTCSSLLPWADNTGRKPCPTAKGLHNFAHPRTDAVVIMAVIDESGEKILLGRNKKWPGKFYSTLAGFIEPGESFEDAVKRELWEEAGVKVWDVKYHSTQPWPYPANLMVGFYATADASQPIRVDLDNELEDARWYTRDEILTVLNHAAGATLTDRDHKKMAEVQEAGGTAPKSASTAKLLAGDSTKSTDKLEEGPQEVPFRVPPLTAIAGVLISQWAHRQEGPGSGAAQVQKGNL